MYSACIFGVGSYYDNKHARKVYELHIIIYWSGAEVTPQLLVAAWFDESFPAFYI